MASPAMDAGICPNTAEDWIPIVRQVSYPLRRAFSVNLFIAETLEREHRSRLSLYISDAPIDILDMGARNRAPIVNACCFN
jgi:hypothetical protein